MHTIDSLDRIRNSFHGIFYKFRKSTRENLFLVVHSLLLSKNCQLPQIILQMCSLLGTNFKANEAKLDRFLKSKTLEIGDTAFRPLIQLVFKLLQERGFFEGRNLIPIVVDFTSHTNKFLILSASIPFSGRAIPIYFSMRVYPQKTGSIDQKKMERAFLRELKAKLPRKYKYLILADRGFGNIRFLKNCSEYGFEYLLRTQKSRNFEINETKQKLEDIKKNKDYQLVKIKDKTETRLVTSYLGKEKSWYLFTSLSKESWQELISYYRSRFQIEKMFQDQKSSGFDLEKSKIQRYGKFKKLLYCICIAQVLTIFTGDWIEENCDEIKRKVCNTHKSSLSVFQLGIRAIRNFFQEVMLYLSLLIETANGFPKPPT